ncbi:MAG: SusC/RagA family TonB-linked outer membrane protein, partial [Niabella sp.]
DIKYVDQNGDGVVNDKDRVVIGRALPVHIGGFNNNFSYKSFSLNIFFQWSYGNDIYNANRLAFEGNFGNREINQYATYANRWTEENQNNTYFRTGGQGPSGMYSSRTIEDGSYLRLKTAQLSYNVNKNIVKKVGIKSASLYVSGQNLLTWTKYSGMDPEVSVRNSTLTPGFDYSAYPRAKTLVFGLKADF